MVFVLTHPDLFLTKTTTNTRVRTLVFEYILSTDSHMFLLKRTCGCMEAEKDYIVFRFMRNNLHIPALPSAPVKIVFYANTIKS